jgi:hypothetical protein
MVGWADVEGRMHNFFLREVNILIEFNVILTYSSLGVFWRGDDISLTIKILLKYPS